MIRYRKPFLWNALLSRRARNMRGVSGARNPASKNLQGKFEGVNFGNLTEFPIVFSLFGRLADGLFQFS